MLINSREFGRARSYDEIRRRNLRERDIDPSSIEQSFHASQSADCCASEGPLRSSDTHRSVPPMTPNCINNSTDTAAAVIVIVRTLRSSQGVSATYSRTESILLHRVWKDRLESIFKYPLVYGDEVSARDVP
ncbi:hypothetical protein V1477_018745 [Vespula maculifrons]|uniref:Uncharacterized protein n=1 Tax=Vespula maculifrons TaxID=7453 RepID=A0ABD2AW89_VESMC